MMPEDMMKMMLQGLLPMKFDIKITLITGNKEELSIPLKGDIFSRKLKGETENRIIIALKTPERDE